METNINALKWWLIIIGGSFHLWTSNPSGKIMRCPLQCDKSSVSVCPRCWWNSTVFFTQDLLIGLMDFPACQPLLLQILITMLDSGIGYLDHYVHSYTVSLVHFAVLTSSLLGLQSAATSRVPLSK